jgi:hypothetical protein
MVVEGEQVPPVGVVFRWVSAWLVVTQASEASTVAAATRAILEDMAEQ